MTTGGRSLSAPAEHAFCNAHPLRERIAIAIAESDSVLSWPKRLIALLCEANDTTIAARAAGFAALPSFMVEDHFAQ